MEQARIEHAPNGRLLTYITSADALVNHIGLNNIYLNKVHGKYIHVYMYLHVQSKPLTNLYNFAIVYSLTIDTKFD